MSLSEVVQGVVEPFFSVVLVGFEHSAVEDMAEQLITGPVKRTRVIVITLTWPFSSHTYARAAFSVPN